MRRPTPINSVPPGEYVPTADQRIQMHSVSWTNYESFIAMRGIDAAGPRVTFYKGVLELMSPSRDHEKICRRLGAVIQEVMDHLGVRYEGLGAWLLEQASDNAALEPDDCYILGDLDKDRPDLAIEVVWTSGGLDKLDVYKPFGVPEVWFWKSDRLRFFVLDENGYSEHTRSVLLPEFDPSLLDDMLELDTLSDVRRELRKRLG